MLYTLFLSACLISASAQSGMSASERSTSACLGRAGGGEGGGSEVRAQRARAWWGGEGGQPGPGSTHIHGVLCVCTSPTPLLPLSNPATSKGLARAHSSPPSQTLPTPASSSVIQGAGALSQRTNRYLQEGGGEHRGRRGAIEHMVPLFLATQNAHPSPHLL